MNNEDDILRPEYPAALIIAGARGKYADHYKKSSNVVVIEEDLQALFPNAESVNKALRQYAKEHNLDKP